MLITTNGILTYNQFKFRYKILINTFYITFGTFYTMVGKLYVFLLAFNVLMYYIYTVNKTMPQKIMKTNTNHAAKSKVHTNGISTGRTLINSLSPNFTYVNKSGGIVQPEQYLIY